PTTSRPASIIQTSLATLRQDTGFRRYLAARACVAFAAMGQAFFAVHATRQLGASDGDVATFSAILLGAQTTSTLLWGEVAGKLGLRLVLGAAVSLGIAAALLALAAPSLAFFGLVFALSGASLGALGVTDPGLPLALAESSGSDRALYVAVANTVLAPIYIIAPLAGGAAADAGGYGLTYVIAAVAGAVALLLTTRAAPSRTKGV
ncbi:MAG TPA: MFS transporter, partial [Chloroflexota bacterium]|nr:MFS transporter [Chloroflexota bacterium]